jgi:hypothetical protein
VHRFLHGSARDTRRRRRWERQHLLRIHRHLLMGPRVLHPDLTLETAMTCDLTRAG